MSVLLQAKTSHSLLSIHLYMFSIRFITQYSYKLKQILHMNTHLDNIFLRIYHCREQSRLNYTAIIPFNRILFVVLYYAL